MKNPIRRTKTVEQICASFRKVVTDLEAVKSERAAEVERLDFSLAELRVKKQVAEGEIAAAEKVSANINKLFS